MCIVDILFNLDNLIKAHTFEETIWLGLDTLLKQTDSRILTNYFVYSKYLGRSSEIDIIVITSYKIYIIEAKSFYTDITGDYKDTVWRGTSGRFDSVIYSPYFQNTIHQFALLALLRKNGVRLNNTETILCFRDSCIIRSDCSNAYSLTGLLRHISYDNLTCKPTIDVDKIHNILLSNAYK